MVKPAARARPPPAAPPSREATRGVMRAPKARRYAQDRRSFRLKTLCRKVKARAKQPEAGTAKAGGQGSEQGKEKGKDVVEMDSTTVLEEFMHTGRTGRRNAMPDISDEHTAALSTAELPLDMAKLSCAEDGASTSQGAKPPQKTSNQPS